MSQEIAITTVVQNTDSHRLSSAQWGARAGRFIYPRTEREIALMQEYRTRLTADVVTGKLDVRPAAAHLPALTAATPAPAPAEAPEELEPEDAVE